MWSNRPYSRVYLFLVLLSLIVTNLSGVEKIQWESISGAQYYTIQLRQNGVIFQELISETNSVSHVLPPGDYDYRISVMNVFDDPVSTTEWTPLRIRSSTQPFIINCSPEELKSGEKVNFTLNVIGYISEENEQTAFHLENQKGNKIRLNIIDSQLNELDSAGFIVTLAVRSPLTIGTWDIVMINPNNRENRLEKAITVTKSIKLRIKSINPPIIRAGSPYNYMSLKIQGMDEDAEIKFFGPSEIIPTLIRKNENGILEYNLNLEKSQSGWYSVEVRNPSGDKAIRKRAFKAEFPIIDISQNKKKPDVKPDEEPDEKIDHKPDIKPTKNYSHTLALGYALNLSLNDEANYFGNGFYGFSIGYSQEIRNKFFRNLLLLKDLDFKIHAMLTTASSNQLLSHDLNIWQISLIPGLCYTTPFNFPINILLQLGFGVSYSIYAVSDIKMESDVENFNLTSLSSIDFVLQLGAGLQVNITNRLFFNLLLEYTNFFYYIQISGFLQPHIEVGFRW